jgi:hypothetical protein
MSQRIPVRTADALHFPCTEPGPTEDVHTHPAFGIYDERAQVITLDSHLPFERQRETLVHETLHAIFSAAQLDSLLSAESDGLDEHVVSVLSGHMLAFLRENPAVLRYLTEMRA